MAASGFTVRVGYMAKALPYPVEVVLPAMQDAKEVPTPAEEPLSIGPKLHIVIPPDNERHLKLGLFLNVWSLLEQTLSLFLLRKLLGTNLRTASIVKSTLGMRAWLEMN